MTTTLASVPIKNVDDSAHGQHPSGKMYDPEGMLKSSETNAVSKFTSHDVGQGMLGSPMLMSRPCLPAVVCCIART